MKKSALCLLLCLLLALPCLSVAEQSQQVNRSCRIYFANGTELASRLNDGRLLTEVNGTEAVEHTFYIDPNGQTVDAVCVQYGEHILPYVVQAQDAQGDWQQIGAYTGDYAQGYAAFPARNQRFRLVFARDGEKLPLSLRQINVFTPGDIPAIEAREWQPSCEKADLLLIVAHPDDELLWFGGALPTYAGERGMAVQVMYMACNSYLRRLELLCGLWECGVRSYPDIGTFSDGRNNDMNGAYARWGRENTYTRIVRAIRRYQPEVILTQDVKGEYGHTQHLVVSDAVYTAAVELAADASYDPQSAQEYGVWQVKKLYRHLGKDAGTIMDYDQLLSAFGGKSAYTIAKEAFDMHMTQHESGHWRVPGPDQPYDSTRYTLVFSTVGEDTQGNDMLENIAPETLSNYHP